MTFLSNFFSKSVDSVMAEFKASVTKLENVASFHGKLQELHQKSAADYTVLANKAKAEVDKAKTTISKITEIFK